MSQLALPLRPHDHAVFESFLPTGNEAVVSLLSSIADNDTQTGCWLWGEPSIGKTHLLQAVCERAGDRSAYLPLESLAAGSSAILDGLASRALVCVDDIERIAGDADWENALFHLFNALTAANGQLVVAAGMAPRECPVRLPDLASRLSLLPTYRLRALGDDDRAAALQLRASFRGLDLPNETARYLLHRSRRDMTSLYELLDTLDREALRAQRRLTIPFVRSVLGTARDGPDAPDA